jgi:hypothetical protein
LQEIKAKLEAEKTDPETIISIGDVGKALAAAWGTLSDEERAPYNEQAKGACVLAPPVAFWRHALDSQAQSLI